MVLSRRLLTGSLWLGLYLFASLLPLAIVFLGSSPPGRDFWTELSVALGFVGLSMLGLQFLITARFRRMSAPYGIDIVLQFHKHISLVAFAFVMLHPIILFVTRPETLGLLNPISAPWRGRFALFSILALVALVGTSLWREQLRLRYESWRMLHGVFAICVILFGVWHAILVGHYLELFWQQLTWAIMAAIVVAALLYVRIAKPILMHRRRYIVENVRKERGDSYSVVLRPEGHRGIRFRPGQFVWLTLDDSPFQMEEHPFTVSSSAESDRLEFTIKELGDFTTRVRRVEPGSYAYIDGPYGVFSIDQYGAESYVLVAGGIGITPMMSMLRTAADRNDERPYLLIYANKRWEDVTFREELDDLKRRLNLTVVHVLEEPPEQWDGHEGFVTQQILREHLHETFARAGHFICGPPAMMEAVKGALDALRVPADQVHMEQFELV